MEPVRLKIREHEYLISSDGSEEEVLRIAEYVNEKLKQVEDSNEGLSEKKTAVLAALNIASDLFHAIRERDEVLTRRRKQAEALIEHIDSVLETAG